LGIARQGFEQILNFVASAPATCITSDSATQLGVLPVDDIFQHTRAPWAGAVGSGAAALASMLPSQTCSHQRVRWSVGQVSPFFGRVRESRIQKMKELQALCQFCP
jgi:hypothetical protein